jgi:hypothetical protein
MGSSDALGVLDGCWGGCCGEWRRRRVRAGGRKEWRPTAQVLGVLVAAEGGAEKRMAAAVDPVSVRKGMDSRFALGSVRRSERKSAGV